MIKDPSVDRSHRRRFICAKNLSHALLSSLLSGGGQYQHFTKTFGSAAAQTDIILRQFSGERVLWDAQCTLLPGLSLHRSFPIHYLADRTTSRCFPGDSYFMGQRRKGHNPKGTLISDAREKDLATIHLINSLLDSVPVDYVQLRKVSAVRGLVNQQVRARVWPVLLGVNAQEFDERAYKIWQDQPHRDSNVVNCDVERSLWSYTEGWTTEERDIERDKLRRVLNAAVSSHDGDVFYYQGLHDITSVLLFICGERLALVLLRRLVTCHLRDCTRPSLDAVLELLGLLLPILEEVDRPLHAHIEASGVQPFFGLSWYITWFAHNLPQLAQAARLFDLFMASHPLMPLYASAAVLVASRRRILRCEDDPAEMHRLLTNLPPLESLTADELAQQAVSIYRRCPPKLLLQRTLSRNRTSTAAESYLKDEIWHVPDKPAVPVGVIGRDALYNLAAYVIPKGRKLRKRAATLASLSIASTLAAVSLGLYMAHYQSTMH